MRSDPGLAQVKLSFEPVHYFARVCETALFRRHADYHKFQYAAAGGCCGNMTDIIVMAMLASSTMFIRDWSDLLSIDALRPGNTLVCVHRLESIASRVHIAALGA